MSRWRRLGSVLALAAGIAACTPPAAPPPKIPAGGPRYPDYPMPDVPAALRVAPDVRRAHEEAWAQLQAGDARAAEREFSDVLKRSPGFYPAEAGLGFALLAERQNRQAATRFGSVIDQNDRYLPAWVGQAEAQLAQGNDAAALTAFEKVLALDPKRESARTKIDLLRFKQLQTLIESGRKSRESGRLDEARASFDRALALSPGSGVILREIALVEIAQGSLDAAEGHLRRAIQADSTDAESYAALGRILESRGRPRDAAAAYASAARIDPRPEWRDRAEKLKDKAVDDAIPDELKTLSTAATVSRADVAALVGMRLQAVLKNAPSRVTPVATDVKGHWAESWILPVAQAGVMEVFPNHTFQPAAPVRRSDLAHVVAQVLSLLGPQHQADITKWKAARPRFVDLPPANIYYPAAALAVASGAMSPQDGNRFAPTRPATGADVTAAVSRLEQLIR